MPRTALRSRHSTFLWRKLSPAKWEDVWCERLSAFRDRLAVTALAGSHSIRLEIFALSGAQAARLARAFGGQALPMKRAHAPARPPIKVRGRLVVVATERERAALGASTRKVLLIPAGMAFGTGDHATTATCLRLLADASAALAGRPWEMLDVGCGSGILALAARMLGARHAEAGDNDPDALRTAAENARANRVSRVVIRKLDVSGWRPARTWDVVAANMYSGLLIEAAPQLARAVAPGGRLIFSGILREQEREVVAAIRAAGLRIESTVRRGKWVTGLATLR